LTILKIWKHYVYEIKFNILSDHKNLKYLFDKKKSTYYNIQLSDRCGTNYPENKI